MALKKVSKRKHPYVVEIRRHFSSEPLSTDERNHCYPSYDVLQVPDDGHLVLLVTSFLRMYNDPRYATVGEGVDFFRQVIQVIDICCDTGLRSQGLRFMHSHHVAHRSVFVTMLLYC